MSFIVSRIWRGLPSPVQFIKARKFPCHVTKCYRQLYFLLVCLTSGLIIVPGQLLAQETLVLNTAFTPPLANNAQTGFLNIVIGEALNRIGYDMEAVRLPAERALINANAGIDDGDLSRIAGLQKIYPNLIQVPEAVLDVEFVVFTMDAEFSSQGWQSLKPYSVAYITGWKILERNIMETAKLTRVKNAEQLFTMLVKKRVDVIIYTRWSGLGYIEEHNLHGIKILEPALDRQSMYVYLHKKHRNLVPKLASALRAMKRDGSYQRAYQKILAPLVEK